MKHFCLTNFIVRYEDGRYNERETCEKIDAYLKEVGYKYLKSYFTNSFSYFKDKKPQLRIIIDGAKTGWNGSHTKKFVLVQNELVDKVKLHDLEEAGKRVAEERADEFAEREARLNAHNTALDDGIKALYRYMATESIPMGSEQHKNIVASIKELESMKR